MTPHLTDTQLYAQLNAPTENAHLTTCPTCQTRLQTLRAQQQLVAPLLQSLAPTTELNSHQALTRFKNYQSQKGNNTMLNNIFSPKFRPLWMGAAAFALAFALLSFTPAREAFSALLALFRVQQVTVVPFNPANLPSALNNRDQKMDAFMSDAVKSEKNGEPQTVASAAEAASQTGFPVRLPSTLSSPKITVQPGGRTTATIDLARLNSMLETAEIKDIKLPANLNGATITIDIPKSVTAAYNCPTPAPNVNPPDRRPPSSDELAKCIAVTQMNSPVVSSKPENIDPKPLGEAFLRVLGLSASEAKALSARIDWTTTLVLPVPTTEATSKDVTVDGVKGTLVLSTRNKQYVLVWVKNNVLYGVMGSGDETSALAIGNSLK